MMPQHRRQRCRIVFSCTNCRHSKQKCDREKPCTSCVRRGRSQTCYYEEAVFDIQRPSNTRSLLPAHMEPAESVIRPPNDFFGTASIRALDSFGYSVVNDHNALGIFKKLARSEGGLEQMTRTPNDNEKHLAPGVLEKYLHLLRLLPSRPYVDSLVAIFFKEVFWQYSIVDEKIFTDRLNTFYATSYDKEAKDRGLSSESFAFPSLLYQVIALALQFLPSDYNRSLDALCMGSSFDYLAGEYSNTGNLVSTLFEKDKTNLVSVQAGLLRVCWLKNCGRVTEAWHLLGQVVMDAREIGLHRLDGETGTHPAQLTWRQIWDLEERRRVWLNLFLWDSEMGMVLGKSMNINLQDCTTRSPIDTKVIGSLRMNAPLPRAEFDKPTPFTQRLVEYRLQINLPQVRELESEGPFPKDYNRVQLLHRKALDYIDKLPAIYRFDNPDVSFDIECPWLVPQREYLCSITWYFVLALHKPYIFTVPESRKEIMQSGIALLKAQRRNFECLQEQHYKLFILAFLTVEATVAILAVLIAYPDDNGEPGQEAFHCVRDSLVRLRILHRNKNALAGPAADVIQVLLNRVETTKIFPTPGLENTLVVTLTIEDSQNGPVANYNQDFSSEYENRRVGYDSHSGAAIADSILDGSGSLPSLNPQETPFEDNNRPLSDPKASTQAFSPSTENIMDSIGTGMDHLFAPLQPIADLTYHDLAPAFDVGFATIQDTSVDGGQDFDSISAEELQQQFTGDFAENSFWSFMNQGL